MQQESRRNRARWLIASSLAILGPLLFLPAPAFSFGTAICPCPPALAPRVQFWERIFTEFSENQRVIHDARYPWVIYEVIGVDGLTQRQIKARVESRKSYYAALLERLSTREPVKYNFEEKRVADLLDSIPGPDRYAHAKERIHSQPGVKELFRLGLRRSSRYLPAIETVLDSMKVPPEIAYLPHVESSFCPWARSKAGAVGLWQFTKRTGKRFMRVERDLDERLDPIRSTEAAARYLLEAHRLLGSWPLAVTAYNHGVGGMLKAQSRFGSGDVGRVLLEYDGPAYGFASQNFYCEFLAAVDLAQNAERHFGLLVPDPPLVADSFRLPRPVKLPALLRSFSLDDHSVVELNPALGNSYLRGARALPAGYVLRLPARSVVDPEVRLASLPVTESPGPGLNAGAPPRSGYKVRPGDTLAQIAKVHRVGLDALRRANDLRAGDRIFPGQVLVVPGKGALGL